MSKSVNEPGPSFESIKNIPDRVDAMYKHCISIRSVLPDKCLEIAEDALKLSLDHGYRKGEAASLGLIGFQYWNRSEIEKGLNVVEKACEIIEDLKAFDLMGDANMVRGMITWGKGEYDRAFKIIYDALNQFESRNILLGSEWLYWSLGVFHYDLKDYKKSLDNYQKTIEILDSKENADPGFYSYALIGMGSVNKGLENFEKATEYFIKARDLSKKTGHWLEEARTHYELGMIHLHNQNYKEAEEGLWISYQMRKDHNTKPGMVSCLLGLSDSKLAQKDDASALELLNEALGYAEETNSKPKVFQCHKKLAELYKNRKDFEKAYHHIEQFYTIKSEVAGEEASNTLKDLETKYATDKSEREKEIHRLKNVELKKANDLIEEKNKEITDSINYARRIQEAILPPGTLVKASLPNSFILYKPKDIVAGDFYWFEVKGELIFFAAADCTGHGVPGAMVSVVCANSLNRAVNELNLKGPGEILDKVRDLVVETFEKSENDVKDGMDIALCALEGNKLRYAGAHNPLWIVRGEEVLETKADKQPIGKYDNAQPYSTHSIDLQNGDNIYVFSDGYVDQFGGEKGKKFMSKNFKKLLLSIQDKSMEEQKTLIDDAFESWRGSEAQVDDVCVIGVRV